MTPERWAEVKAIVAGALEMPLAERGQYVERACAADRALRTEVDSVLAAADGTDSVPGARAAVADAREDARARTVWIERDAPEPRGLVTIVSAGPANTIFSFCVSATMAMTCRSEPSRTMSETRPPLSSCSQYL